MIRSTCGKCHHFVDGICFANPPVPLVTSYSDDEGAFVSMIRPEVAEGEIACRRFLNSEAVQQILESEKKLKDSLDSLLGKVNEEE